MASYSSSVSASSSSHSLNGHAVTSPLGTLTTPLASVTAAIATGSAKHQQLATISPATALYTAGGRSSAGCGDLDLTPDVPVSSRRPHSSRTSSSGSMTTANPWQFQFNRKKRHRIAHRRRHGNHYGASGRPNSLLLPIDERDELQELLGGSNGGDGGDQLGSGSSSKDSTSVLSAKRSEKEPNSRTSRCSTLFAPLAEGDEDDDGLSSGEDEDDSDESGGSSSGENSPGRRLSSTGLIDLHSKSLKSNNVSSPVSRLSSTLKKAKNFMSKGKWSIY